MQREYLRGLGLEDEIIEKILAENGRDIKAEQEKIPKDYDSVKAELKKLKEEKGTDQNSESDLDDPTKQALLEAKKLQEKYQKSLSEIKVKEAFVKAGLAEDDYKDILNMVVTDNEEDSVSRAQELVRLITVKNDATEKRVREEVLKNTTPPPAGSGGEDDDITEAGKFAEKYSKQFTEGVV